MSNDIKDGYSSFVGRAAELFKRSWQKVKAFFKGRAVAAEKSIRNQSKHSNDNKQEKELKSRGVECLLTKEKTKQEIAELKYEKVSDENFINKWNSLFFDKKCRDECDINGVSNIFGKDIERTLDMKIFDSDGKEIFNSCERKKQLEKDDEESCKTKIVNEGKEQLEALVLLDEGRKDLMDHLSNFPTQFSGACAQIMTINCIAEAMNRQEVCCAFDSNSVKSSTIINKDASGNLKIKNTLIMRKIVLVDGGGSESNTVDKNIVFTVEALIDFKKPDHWETTKVSLNIE